METGSVKRQPQGEFEDTPSSSMRNQGSTSAFAAMVACNVILLLMLSACSPAHAQAVQVGDLRAAIYKCADKDMTP